MGFLLAHKSVVPFVADKYLADFGVSYTKIEGTLLHGVVIYDAAYEDKISAKKLEIQYNILNLLRKTPKITQVRSEHLYINSDKFASSDANTSDFYLFAHHVENLSALHTEIVVENKTLFLDAEAKELFFDGHLEVQNIALKLKSVYANASMEGTIQADKLIAKGVFELEPSLSLKYLSFIKSVPKKQKFALEATLESIKLFTQFPKLQLSSEEDFTLTNAEVDLSYIWGKNDFDIEIKHDFLYKEYTAKNRAKVWVNTDGKYKAELKVTHIKEPFGLEIFQLNALVLGDAQNIEVKLKNANIDAIVKSTDYENYEVSGEVKDLKLSFASNLPQNLQEEVVSFRTQASVQISPLHVNANASISTLYGTLETAFIYEENSILCDIEAHPNAEHKIYKEYNLKNFLPFKLSYKNGKKTQKIEINANALEAKLLQNGANIQGDGALGGTKFHLVGDLQTSEIDIESKIPSLKKLLATVFKDSLAIHDVYDAHVELQTHINYADKFSIKTGVKIPLYVVEVDAKTSYVVENITLESSYEDGNLIIENYFLQSKQHDFYSKKPSIIRFDKDFNMQLEALWLYDTILIKGFVNKESLEGNITLESDKFSYKGEHADVNASIHLQAAFSPKMQKIEGKITLLEGEIRYKPLKDYAIEDSDIIVIQEIQESKSSRLFLSVQVDSAKPIAYKIKDVNLLVTPHIRLSQEADGVFKVSGMLTINEGNANLGGKKFEFDKSEIYFNGDKPSNPQLNLNIHHYTIDYIDIEIYVTNTLEEPVIIFSSKPAISQNDIMSYILFGESASSMFDPSSDASKSSLLLAGGLKQLVNETSPIKVDTLNVLTNKEGTLGYEIGSRFNEKIRIVYKNDTASSIILQYSLSKSLRIEVDIRETGQGVSIIYVKDL